MEATIVQYKKTCLWCKKPFESPSRNTRYCPGKDCGDKYRKSLTKRRKEYKANAEYESLINKAYRLSYEVAERFIPKPEVEADEKLELHHRDCNVFNCSPTNLQWVVKKKHAAFHSKLPDVNMTIFLKIVDFKPGILEELSTVYDAQVLEGKGFDANVFSALALTSRFKLRKIGE